MRFLLVGCGVHGAPGSGGRAGRTGRVTHTGRRAGNEVRKTSGSGESALARAGDGGTVELSGPKSEEVTIVGPAAGGGGIRRSCLRSRYRRIRRGAGLRSRWCRRG